MNAKLPVSLLVLSSSALAQIHAPASANPNTIDCNARNNYVFQRVNSRGQCFYDLAEVGGNPTFVVNSADLRWDAVTAPGGGAGPFTMNLTVLIGTTTKSIAQVNADMAGSLSGPLSTLFSGNINYLPHDPIGPNPKPWGAQNGQFTFPSATPVPIAIPTGGSFVFELRGINGTIAATNALVDFHQDAGALVAGTAVVLGTGCPATNGGASTTLTFAPTPQLAPGTAISLTGANLGPNNLVLTWVGSSTVAFGSVPLPFAVPGTTCNLYVDPMLLVKVQTANAAGAINAFQAGSLVVLPKDPALNGSRLNFQSWSVGAPHATNPFGIFFTNAQVVTVGSTNPSAMLQAWFNGYHVNATNPEASFCGHGGYAVRLN